MQPRFVRSLCLSSLLLFSCYDHASSVGPVDTKTTPVVQEIITKPLSAYIVGFTFTLLAAGYSTYYLYDALHELDESYAHDNGDDFYTKYIEITPKRGKALGRLTYGGLFAGVAGYIVYEYGKEIVLRVKQLVAKSDVVSVLPS